MVVARIFLIFVLYFQVKQNLKPNYDDSKASFFA